MSLTDLILRFNTSPERGVILDGLLRFCTALHAVGLVDGFQWPTASFLEDIETLESRPPDDVDVVSFFHLPVGRTQAAVVALNPDLFDRRQRKATYHVDSYVQSLAAPSEPPFDPALLVQCLVAS